MFARMFAAKKKNAGNRGGVADVVHPTWQTACTINSSQSGTGELVSWFEDLCIHACTPVYAFFFMYY